MTSHNFLLYRIDHLEQKNVLFLKTIHNTKAIKSKKK